MKRVYLCRGSNCRKSAAFADVRRVVEDSGCNPKIVGCQKICKGPVVGFEVDDKLFWFKRVGTPKAWAALAKALHGGPLKRSLKKRRVDKRTGKLR